MNNNTNQLIELIYEAAITPSRWGDLMVALAEVAEQVTDESVILDSERSLLSIMPDTSINDDSKVKASISETLKSITNINEDETLSTTVDGAGQVNDLLIRHFSRAIKIAKRLVDLDEQHNVVLSLLDRMPIALVLVDATARVIETNALADELLSSDDGLKVTAGLLDSGSSNNKRLLNAIEIMSKHDLATTRGESLSITNEKTQNNIMLFIAPLKQYGTQQRSSVAVFISQRKSLPLSLPKKFSEQYGLTKKELYVTEQLVRGLSIKNISEEASVSQHTVRSQVKSVLKKTDTSRQAELVSLVYNGMTDFDLAVPENLPGKQNTILGKTKIGLQDYDVLTLTDGRNMAYKEYGDLNGEPLFHCHSVSGSRLEIAFNAQQILEQKAVRLIVMDRPGYGASDPDPKTSFLNWTEDLVQLADHLNIEKFSLTGYAMGGAYALACAHQIPQRIKRIAIISSGLVVKYASDYETVTPMVKLNYRLAKYFPKLYRLMNTIQIKSLLNDPGSFINMFSEKMDQADRDILKSDSFKVDMVTALTEGFRQGGKALARDVIQAMHEWYFEPSAINVPLDIWHGTSDFVVPVFLAKRLDEQVKNSRLFIKEGEGQYMFYTHWAEILDELLRKE